MSAGRTERRLEGSAAAIVILVLLSAGLVAGCESPFGDDDPEGERTEQATQTAEEQVDALLRRRAVAVRSGQLTAFLDDVDDTEARFVRQQRTYFGNLRELPLAKFSYHVHPGSVEVNNDEVQAVVGLELRLRSYDRLPVVSSNFFTFRTRDDGTLALAGARDRAFERDHEVQLQPWDLLDIEVIEADGVLGVFDQESVDAAYQIMPAVQEAMAHVDIEVPLPWNHRVVVYALTDIRVMAGLSGLPGGDPDALDGVSFAVQAVPGSPRIASTRFMLHPRMIFRTGPVRERLIRHELTHVALGTRDDRVPKWLSEGMAEYVSVQPLSMHEWEIARPAVRMARRGLEALPADRTFNGPLSGANYGIAWFACQYVARVFGEDSLWRLFDAMRARGGTSEREQDAVLRKELGLDSHELASLAGQEILATFG